MSYHFTLTCIHCHKSLPKGEFAYMCPSCQKLQKPHTPPVGVLKTLYPYEEIRQQCPPDQLFDHLKKRNFIDLLPLRSYESTGPLRVGQTPLYRFEQKTSSGNQMVFYLKDDSQNPTFSFKDRASLLVSAYAREQGINTLVAASTGNAGSSLAGICASQNQHAIIMVPRSAPVAKLIQIMMYGAIPVLIDGNYDTAFDLSIEASKELGWFNRNTAYNPFTIEGKKTVAFEIYDQLQGKLPSRIFVPVGDGVIISGLYKGFEDLLKLGIIKAMPLIVAVQSESSDNLVRNMDTESFQMKTATTIADSISVDYPRNFFMAQSFLQKYHGQWLSVSDQEIMQAAGLLARTTGIFAEPAAAAAMAGMRKYALHHKSEKPEQPMLVLSTGSGLKDIQTHLKNLTLPHPIKPDIKSLKKYIQTAN